MPSAGLDPEQHAIVTHDGGPLLVVAGPGAGKTRVLTHAIAHRIGAGLLPESCLAVTFTRRARDELRDRLAALLGADAAARVTVATFHGLGLLILREQGKLLGLDADLKVADEKTRQEVLRLLSARERPAALGARIAAAKRIHASSGRAATDSLAVVGLADDGTAGGDAELAGLVERYDAALRERGLVDVDDLVTLPTTLLAGNQDLAAEYRARWTDVFVDEYQDVDEQQYLMLRQLAAPGVADLRRSATPTRRFTGSGAATWATSCASRKTSAAELPTPAPPRCGCRAATAPRRRSCGPRCS